MILRSSGAKEGGKRAAAQTRPSMRFVPVKSEATQALLMTHKVREFLVRQLTQTTNAIRAHLGEFGIQSSGKRSPGSFSDPPHMPRGVHNVGRLLDACEQADLPDCAKGPIRLLADQFFQTRDRIDRLTRDIRREAETSEAARRLQTIPGIGPITATALTATLPDASGFRSSRDLSAWLGLTPKPHSSGGKGERANAMRSSERSNAGADFQDGQSISAAIAVLGRPGRHHGAAPRRTWRRLALAHPAEKDSETGRHRIGQPHGQDGMGVRHGSRTMATSWLT